jgi:hypothetical protein
LTSRYGPLLAFESTFDLLVTTSEVAILRGDAFETVFRDLDSMKERIPTWSGAVAQALPLDDVSAQRLQALCERNSRVLRQVRSMYERGVLRVKFSLPALRDELTRQGLEANRLIKNGKLVLEDDDIHGVLKVLDEKFYQGWHSQTRWDVGTRSPRSS